jgi:hypothetical protein
VDSNGPVRVLIIIFSRLFKDIQTFNVLIVIKRQITLTQSLIVIPVTSRIILQQQIPITLQLLFLQPAALVIR